MCVGRGALEKNERGKGLNQALFRFVLYIIIYVVAQAVTSETLTRLLPSIGYQFPPDYIAYVNILLALAFGYLTVGAVANAAYWSMRVRVPHSTASAVRSMIRLVGLGALMVAIAGGVAGGAAGVALGGFLGLVVGQATQSTLGQAIAGCSCSFLGHSRLATK